VSLLQDFCSITDEVPNVPQTPEFFREAGHAPQTMVASGALYASHIMIGVILYASRKAGAITCAYTLALASSNS
jgi:hypothetical protein